MWRAALLLIVVGLAAAAWIGVRGWQANEALTAAVQQVETLQDQVLAGDTDAAEATLVELREQTQLARDLTSDPVWDGAAMLPWAGRNLGAVAAVAVGVDDLVDLVMPPIIESAGTMDLTAVRPVDGRIDLEPLVALRPTISEASDAAASVLAGLLEIETDGLMDLVARPVEQAQERVGELALTLRTGERATLLLPPMLGADGPRTYLVLLQTNAELRASGGLPGAMSIITADQGVLTMTGQDVASGMAVYPEPVTPLDAEDEALYTDRLGRYMGDVNLTPDFPTTAVLAAEMWRRHSGQEVDGVLATDPVALSYLLGATGPVDDGAGGYLRSGDVVRTLLSTVYERFPDSPTQDTYFAGVAASVFGAVADGQGQASAMVPALAKAAGEHRLRVWSTRAEERAELAGTVLAGTMPAQDGATAAAPSTVGVFFNDSTGSKMDVYLDTDVELVGSRCEAGATVHTLRVSLANVAPLDAATSLTRSVTGPGTHGVPLGSIGTSVVIVGTAGGEIAGVALDRHPVGLASYTQDSRPATVMTVELAPGEAAVVEVDLTDSRAGAELAIWSTPTRDKPGLRTVTSGLREC